MKTISCKNMGGTCDATISGNTPQEMVANGMKHLEEAHPEMLADVKNMTSDETAKWMADFQTKWDALPEDAEAAAEKGV